MSDLSRHTVDMPLQQKAIHDRCFHPTGIFTEFKEEAVEQSIPNRFEEQVRRYPERIAVKSQGQELTYDQLNRAANRLAQTILTGLGEGLEPVAVLFEHGAQMVVALLGVLKARKFCVPVDASHPTPRISSILENSQASLIVTNSRNLSLANELAKERCKVVNIDEMDASVSKENPGLAMTPDDFAAIVYTSGSTGAPKGVAHNHRSLLHMAMNFTNGCHICQEDRIGLAFSLSAIGGVNNTLVALLNGAALYPFDVKHGGLANLPNWLAEEELTIFRLPVSVFRQLVGILTDGENSPKLRVVHVSTESIFSTDLELYKKYFSQECIFGLGLGATEISPFTEFLCDKHTQIIGRSIPVGYPVEGAEILLLDDGGKVVGIGEVGEIAVKSRYLAQGYWNDPDLTRTKFLPDPHGADERIYLTGDLGRVLPDGCLIHLGRKDFQVKIRGYKVILGEVEAALCDLDEITEAVVVNREDGRGNNRLVAYVTAAVQPAPTISEIRRALSQKLLDYMLPQTFVILDQMPVLPNGKVDRQALPALASARPALNNDYSAPRTAVETTLVRIWSGVLGLDQVGVNDNFLELGGDSLLAGQVISRVISAFRVELPLRSLFESPTVAEMALVVTQNQAMQAKPEDIERMLAELEALSDTEARQLLADRSAANCHNNSR